VQVRDDLLSFLREDSKRRSATILCGPAKVPHISCELTQITLDATHIFDGLNEFPTHIAHMRLGSFVMDPMLWPPSHIDNVGALDGALFRTALQWLRGDRDHRRELEKDGRKTRGARRDQVQENMIIWGCAAN